MTSAELRTPAGIRTSFVQQLRLLGWSGRWTTLVLALLFLLVVVGLTTIETQLGRPRVLVAAMLGLPAPVLWALLVWHGELPHRRSYHWSLPVPRPGHDLARIAAGAVWLVAAYLVLAAGGAIAAVASGDWARFAAIGPGWTTFFAGPLVLYFLVSPLALWSDSPTLRRGMVAFMSLGGVAALLDFEWYARAMEAVFGDGWGMTTALFGGFLRPPGMESPPPGELATAALWLAIGVVATVGAATYRPVELARFARRRAPGSELIRR